MGRRATGKASEKEQYLLWEVRRAWREFLRLSHIKDRLWARDCDLADVDDLLASADGHIAMAEERLHRL